MTRRHNLTIEQKRKVLESYGYTIGERDFRFKTKFPGAHMVLESDDESEIDDCWCIVGDDLSALISEAFDAASSFSYFDAVCEDVLAGGEGILHTNGHGAGPAQ